MFDIHVNLINTLHCFKRLTQDRLSWWVRFSMIVAWLFADRFGQIDTSRIRGAFTAEGEKTPPNIDE